jgi:hypothetical protein
MYLKATLQEVFNPKSKHVIELHALVVQHTDTHKTTNQGITLKQTFRVLFVHSQKLTGSTTTSICQNPE